MYQCESFSKTYLALKKQDCRRNPSVSCQVLWRILSFLSLLFSWLTDEHEWNKLVAYAKEIYQWRNNCMKNIRNILLSWKAGTKSLPTLRGTGPVSPPSHFCSINDLKMLENFANDPYVNVLLSNSSFTDRLIYSNPRLKPQGNLAELFCAVLWFQFVILQKRFCS